MQPLVPEIERGDMQVYWRKSPVACEMEYSTSNNENPQLRQTGQLQGGRERGRQKLSRIEDSNPYNWIANWTAYDTGAMDSVIEVYRKRTACPLGSQPSAS